MKLASNLLVSLVACSALAENNPDVFQSLHLSLPAGTTSLHWQAASYPTQIVPPAEDINWLIPGLTYWFETWGDAGQIGSRITYTAPGVGFIGYQPGRVRYVVKPQQRTRLLASPDLKTWTVVADKVWTVDGVAEFFEPATGTARFYRTLDN